MKFNKTLKCYSFVFREIYRANKFLLFVAVISTVTSGVVPPATLYMLRKITAIIESIVYSQSTEVPYKNLIFLVLLYFSLIITQDLVSRFKIVINKLTDQSLVYNIQIKLIDKIKKVEYKMFYSVDFQNRYSNVLSNINNEPMQIVMSIFVAIGLSVQFIRIVAALFYLSPHSV